MRRFARNISMLAAITAVFACGKAEFPEPQSPQVDNPSFTATIGTFCDIDTKTTVDGFNVSWVEGDRISIVDSNGRTATYAAAEAGTSTTFEFVEGDQLAAEGPYSAYYPANIVHGALAWQQIGSTSGITESAPMYAEAEGTNLVFDNICGLVRFELSTALSGVLLKKIHLSAEIDGAPGGLSGKYGISEGKAVVTSIDPVELNLRSAMAIGTQAKPFYIAVPEGDYNPFRITFEASSGATQKLKSNKTISIRAGQITTVTLSADRLVMDLSAGESANCYIAHRSGAYKFKAVKGNSTETVGTVDHAGVIWETANTTTAPAEGAIVKNVSVDGDYIVFQAGSAQGNALIAAYDASGNVLWSWHIWRCDNDPEVQVYDTGAAMMDRNIGALKNDKGGTAVGFVYQWGRKDPFTSGYGSTRAATCPEGAMAVTSDAGSHTDAYATAHPATFICGTTNNDWLSTKDDKRWGAAKTVNDPCPPGYKVPQLSAWSSDLSACTWQGGSSTNGMYYKDGAISGDTECWYPAGGEIQVSNGAFQNANVRTFYWCSNVSGNNANALQVKSGAINKNALNRGYGMAVRCVSTDAKAVVTDDMKLAYAEGSSVHISGSGAFDYDFSGNEFTTITEVKPLAGLGSLLVTAQGGGVAVVDIAAGTARTVSTAMSNAHSAEILPDGNIAVACAGGNGSIEILSGENGTVLSSTALAEAHGVVWDASRSLLWAAGDNSVRSYRYSAGTITLNTSHAFPGQDPHDLFPVHGSDDELWVPGSMTIYKFNAVTGKFSYVKAYAGAKSISDGPENYNTAIADWSGTVTSLEGRALLSLGDDASIYKARWMVENTFSYGSHMPEATDLSATETANCYIAPTISTMYKFRPTRGNSSELISGIASVAVIWSILPGTTAPTSHSNYIESVDYYPAEGYIVFKTGVKQGNSVIAAMDSDGNILWSWHIWRANYSATDVTLGTGAVMMDRNLGSFGNSKNSANSIGLAYQWGRKDPFPGNGATNANSLQPALSNVDNSNISGPVSVAESIRNPMRYVTPSAAGPWCSESTSEVGWSGSTKTIYDPCPAGYMVPDKSVWGTTFNAGEFTWANYGVTWTCNSVEVWYQANGQYGWNGVFNSGSSLVNLWTRNLSSGIPVRMQAQSTAAAKTGGAHSAYGGAVRCQKIQ